MSQRRWVIVAIFPDHRPQEIARTCHRSDADDYLRFLQQHIFSGQVLPHV